MSAMPWTPPLRAYFVTENGYHHPILSYELSTTLEPSICLPILPSTRVTGFIRTENELPQYSLGKILIDHGGGSLQTVSPIAVMNLVNTAVRPVPDPCGGYGSEIIHHEYALGSVNELTEARIQWCLECPPTHPNCSCGLGVPQGIIGTVSNANYASTSAYTMGDIVRAMREMELLGGTCSVGHSWISPPKSPPPKLEDAEELTPDLIVDMLGGPTDGPVAKFNAEGGFRFSDN